MSRRFEPLSTGDVPLDFDVMRTEKIGTVAIGEQVYYSKPFNLSAIHIGVVKGEKNGGMEVTSSQVISNCEWGVKTEVAYSTALFWLLDINELTGKSGIEARVIADCLRDDFFKEFVLTLPRSRSWCVGLRHLSTWIQTAQKHPHNKKRIRQLLEALQAKEAGVPRIKPEPETEKIKSKPKPKAEPKPDRVKQLQLKWTSELDDKLRSLYSAGVPIPKLREAMGLGEEYSDDVRRRFRQMHDQEGTLSRKGKTRVVVAKAQTVEQESDPKPRELSEFERSSLRVLAALRKTVVELQAYVTLAEGEGAELTHPVVAEALMAIATEERHFLDQGLPLEASA